ncbi:gasdermin-E-like [Cygnus olor]|uniref:gasdermin-E-like n=1 Tax=Cygnus olor TaxID=8869 RepID=UPI001ADE2F6B|nr:gasdermin-E-like [Cygnus olor]
MTGSPDPSAAALQPLRKGAASVSNEEVRRIILERLDEGGLNLSALQPSEPGLFLSGELLPCSGDCRWCRTLSAAVVLPSGSREEQEFCLLDEQQGGFERESTEGSTYPHSAPFRDALFLYQPDAVDNGVCSGARNLVPRDASLSVLKQDLSWLKAQFQPFAKLPEEKQRALYKSLCELLLREEMLTALADVLDDICTGDKPDLKELKPAQQQDLVDFLQLLGCSNEVLLQNCQLQDEELVSAAHLLISAVSELSDYTLVLLRACCGLQVVPALCCLPNIASADGTLALSSPLVATLTDRGRFDVVQRLFASSSINLEMTESSVKVVTAREPRFFPLLLYVALYGLHSLGGTA